MILINAIFLLVICYYYKKELKKNEELERELKEERTRNVNLKEVFKHEIIRVRDSQSEEQLPQMINDAEAEKKALSGRVNTLEEATRKRQLESVISFLHERCEHDN